MNDTPTYFSLEKATNSVNELKLDVGKGIIALGKWIAIVKENIPKTEFLDWLKYTVKLSNFTAYRYMRIAREIDPHTLEKLGPQRIYEMMELPEGQFKKDLMEIAKGMSVDEVKEAVAHFTEKVRGEQTEVVGLPERETVVELPKSHDMALRANAEFMEKLEDIVIEDIPENYYGLFVGQLSKTVKLCTQFLTALNYDRKK